MSSSSSSSSIYTKKGDHGYSSLFNNERRPKFDRVFEALGAVDELNAHLGMCAELIEQQAQQRRDSMLAAELGELDLRAFLIAIQEQLLDLGSYLATPRTERSSMRKKAQTEFPSEHTVLLEQWIDEWDRQLPPLKNFILPGTGGGLASASLHVARAVARRAERSISPMIVDGSIEESIGFYMNRLSDLLFIAARKCANASPGNEEMRYKKGKGVLE